MTHKKLETLEQLADFLDALPPEKFDMSEVNASCGRPACIGGWLLESNSCGPDSGIFETMHRSFGTSLKDAENICYPNSAWNTIDGKRVNPYDATPKQTARLVRHYAKTGKVEWGLAMSEGVI